VPRHVHRVGPPQRDDDVVTTAEATHTPFQLGRNAEARSSRAALERQRNQVDDDDEGDLTLDPSP
jgi:hypothetical protein